MFLKIKRRGGLKKGQHKEEQLYTEHDPRNIYLFLTLARKTMHSGREGALALEIRVGPRARSMRAQTAEIPIGSKHHTQQPRFVPNGSSLRR